MRADNYSRRLDGVPEIGAYLRSFELPLHRH